MAGRREVGFKMNQSDYLHIDKYQFGLYSKFRALKDIQINWYKSEVLKHLKLKRLPSICDDQIIKQILAKSPNDNEKKLTTKTYYVSNVIAYLKTINSLLSEDFIANFSKPFEGDESLIVYNYHRIVQNLLFDSLVLLNEYSQNVENKPPIYQCGKSNKQHNLTIYKSLRQSIYGQSSFHSSINVQPDLSISIIRQLVELRIRRAFGILAWYDNSKSSIEVMPMNSLFEIIKKYKDDIEFSMPFDCLIRVYGWSNIFLHSGIKDYSWKHIFVTDYLNEFALGKPANSSGLNVYSGIALEQMVLDNVVIVLKMLKPEGFELITCNPEAYITK